MFYRISPRIRFVDEPEGDKVPDVLPDVTPEKVVDEAPATDDLGERVERIEHAVTDLTETVAALAPVPGVDPDPSDAPPHEDEPERDESPASVPWTHKKLFGH